jgi:glycosyltransferase involved in cell wall biosynthesis
MVRKRVGLDGRALSNISRQRGIGRYTSSLIPALIERGSDFDFVVFGYGKKETSALPPEVMDETTWVSLPAPLPFSYPGLLADHLLMARTVSRSGVDLFHAIDHNMTPFLKCPYIVTVHDLIPLVLRGPYLGPRSFLWLEFHKMAARRARAVVAVSRNSASDVERLWRIEPERIRVIPEGVSDIYHPVDDGAEIEKAMARFGIKRPYFLYLGGFDPRKNIGNMLLAFKRFLLNGSCDYSLALCGDTAGFEDHLRDGIQELGLEDKVVLTGFVEEEALPPLYSGSEAFLCVSLYEGFGLPLLEAMACAAPVIASDTSSMPEVVGEAGVLVDPADPDDILRGMEKVAESFELREQLKEKGRARAASFTWERSAERFLWLYKEVLRGGGRG